MKRLVLCADDFGQDEAVVAAICGLARRGRLSAVSCLALGPAFAAGAAVLRGAEVDLGLHLDLTGGAGPLLAPLPVLLARAYSGALDRAEVGRRLAAQLDAFEAAAGRPPDFLDGHQHVHQLPIVRDVVLATLEHRYRAGTVPVRNTVPRRHRGAKAAVVAALGGRALREALRRRAIPHNGDFAGVYGLHPGADYAGLMRGWLASIDDGGLLLCHPGEPGGSSADPIGPARVSEHRYLASEAFPRALAGADAALVRHRDLFGGSDG